MEKTVTSNNEFGDRRRSGVYGNSSTDSSSIGGFSSTSDTDSLYAAKKKKSLKPIRTSFSDLSTNQSENFSDEFLYRKNRSRSGDKPTKGDGSGAGRTAKSRAMKFYGELKRMKQPISPGGKLATFLNSLFNASGNAKKQRISTSATATGDVGKWERSESKPNYTTTSTPTCSTASSYSRSCLSKTPSSAGAKRSVRFSPVSVVIDEDLGTRGRHRSLRGDENLTTATDERSMDYTKSSAMGGGSEELKLRAVEKNRRVEETAMELLKNYNKKWELSGGKGAEINDNGEEEDAESCCSSDLFELDNLIHIGVDRYCAELPVYETTRVDTNRAIASGFIVV